MKKRLILSIIIVFIAFAVVVGFTTTNLNRIEDELVYNRSHNFELYNLNLKLKDALIAAKGNLSEVYVYNNKEKLLNTKTEITKNIHCG